MKIIFMLLMIVACKSKNHKVDSYTNYADNRDDSHFTVSGRELSNEENFSDSLKEHRNLQDNSLNEESELSSLHFDKDNTSDETSKTEESVSEDIPYTCPEFDKIKAVGITIDVEKYGEESNRKRLCEYLRLTVNKILSRKEIIRVVALRDKPLFNPSERAIAFGRFESKELESLNNKFKQVDHISDFYKETNINLSYKELSSAEVSKVNAQLTQIKSALKKNNHLIKYVIFGWAPKEYYFGRKLLYLDSSKGVADWKKSLSELTDYSALSPAWAEVELTIDLSDFSEGGDVHILKVLDSQAQELKGILGDGVSEILISGPSQYSKCQTSLQMEKGEMLLVILPLRKPVDSCDAEMIVQAIKKTLYLQKELGFEVKKMNYGGMSEVEVDPTLIELELVESALEEFKSNSEIKKILFDEALFSGSFSLENGTLRIGKYNNPTSEKLKKFVTEN